MGFASQTTVSVERSQMEVRKILGNYKATGFAFGEQGHMHMVMFEIANRRMRFVLPMPEPGVARDRRKYIMGQNQIDQERRRRWRCLALAIKAKLECVESGITTLEEEFMAHIVIPNGQTVGQHMIPQIKAAYESGKMPAMLGYDGGSK